MIRRPAVTLMEVLIAMFIMAIGMLALLTLFPLGAISMAQALKDDRCASTAAMAENIALATNLRTDPNVTAAFLTSTTIPPMVYVDPYGSIQGLKSMSPSPPNLPPGAFIPRVAPSFALTAQLADRWFSLPDDIGFNASGTPDTFNTGSVDRGRRYSYAYLLKRLGPNLVQAYVVVYNGRPVNTLSPLSATSTGETHYPLVAVTPPNGLVLGVAGTTIKRGGWIFDPINGYFYRVTNLAEVGTTTTLEVQPNLIVNPVLIVVMDSVAEVFDKGTNAQP